MRARVVLCAGAWFASAVFAQGDRAVERERLPSAEQLRRQLDRLEAERREEVRDAPNFQFGENQRPAMKNPARDLADKAALEIVHEADRLTCVWEFRPVESDAETRNGEMPIRVCRDVKGSEWIALAPGEWSLRLRAGEVGWGEVALDPQMIRVRAGRSYRLYFGERDENELKFKIRDRLRERKIRPEAQKSGAVPTGRP